MNCPTFGKHCHTRAAAKAHLAGLRRRNPVAIARMSVYKCPDWKLHPEAMFHVGHTPSRKNKGWRPRPM